MVMEASPSPQSVGREFVRQYYTLLNKAPAHLHRFYNNYSSFVHGGLDAPHRETPPVVGQKQIHNRIQQLNFRDCHAKISQVDSQATLGSGVVVQVTGELSNGGAPMRRFTQTFVLAAQSPKKYYVHNDIFRYQDIVFSDDSGSGSARSDGSEEEGGGYYPPPPQPAAFPPAPFPAPPPPPAAPALNGHPAPVPDERAVVAAMQAATISPPEAPSPPPAEPEPQPEPEPEPEPQPEPTQTVVAAPAAPPAAPEPKTYANLLKSGGAAPPPQRQSPPQQQAPPPAAPVSHEPRPRPPRPPRDARDAPPPPAEGVRRYPDSQQLFLGNLPHSATEEALRALFSRFGPVAELRVHSKPAAPHGPRHPNYGFLTFESEASAQECLNNVPLYFPENSPDGVKLNVEEKKRRAEAPRRRPPSGSRAPFPRPYRR
ncbi:ras GTPase-activating protein-binding protein 2 isoform X1 [Plutella xylostella]|uniref:ras GTPase-activating protein-binding protein 2 isoform X1 n=1 Tax=Plutella xylostella TaxID=51655 RepID=UPI00203276ED|nr:ras GTPase-activating protein-binding protein 2 isoform X1 [Plutella xylostella]XP_048477891.1 ras GTPase-activating protein-binding protein 2 isoform X1 [Plutella xylostella]